MRKVLETIFEVILHNDLILNGCFYSLLYNDLIHPIPLIWSSDILIFSVIFRLYGLFPLGCTNLLWYQLHKTFVFNSRDRRVFGRFATAAAIPRQVHLA